MAGYDPAKAARMNQLAQQYPNASLSTLATLARVSVSDLGNYTNDSVGTRASNANFGRVTSESSQGVQSTTTPRNTVGSGSAFAGNDIPPTTVSSVSSTPSINPFTGRAYTTPPTPVVTSPPSSQNNTNTTGSGTSFQGGGTIASQAFGNGGRDPAPAPDPFPAPPPARPVQAQDSDVDFTDAYGENYRQATPIPTPVVQPQDDDVDFTDAYGESYTEVTPIPANARRPGVEQAQPFQPPQRAPQTFEEANEDIEDAYSEDFRTADDIARANRADVPTPTPRPDITAPEPPPARPAQEISQVDDFGGTGITEVDDFGGPSRNVTPVDDFSGSAVPPQVDDFAEINTPAQVDDFGGYSNNDFGTEDPGLDAFGPGPTPPPPASVQEYDQTQFDPFGDVVQESAPAQVDDFAEYQSPAQVDDFAEFQAPAQVDDFGDYSDNNFGAQVDDFGEINTPAQVDDFSGYSNNDFGTEDPGLDAFGPGPDPTPVEPEQLDWSNFNDGDDLDTYAEDYTTVEDNPIGYERPGQQDDGTIDHTSPEEISQVDDFGDNNFGTEEEDFSDFATPEEVNPFGVDDFGDPEAAQFDEFGDPILAPEDRVDNDGESLVGDDDTFLNDPDANAGIDGVEQAAISQQQEAALQAQALKAKAQQQQTVSEMREASGVKNADGDWRVKLRLAPQATYLYQAPDPGILAPLTETDGIIFPYTPSIDIQYRAEYNAYSPTHSNYQHFFYQGSSVATVQLNADFTAQDTVEAEYLLAVIHFLKSASKMFYGQDSQRGSPPPLLYLTGLGEYQFNESPCVISEFNYNLPPDVNYIRARSKQIQRDGQLQYQKPLATSVTNGNFSSLTRLQTATANAINGKKDPIRAGAETTKLGIDKLGTKGATYVPTKATISLVLNPIVSRQQVSQQFSLREYANGNLIKKGMW